MPVYQQPFYYRVYLDLDRDGSFETGEEITAYVMNVSIIRGMSGMRLVADVGKCVITLRNDDKRFTLSNTGSPYYNQLKTNVPVRVDVVDDTETYTIFRGVIYTIALQPGEKGTARLGRAVIECVDLMGILQAHRISLPLQSSKTPQYLINLITSAAFRTAYATNNITFSANPADADTVTINGTAYRFKTSIAQANDVAIGSTVEDTVDNLVAAIVGKEGSGTKYYAGTTRPDGVSAKPRMTYYREVQKSRPIRYYRLGESAGTNADDVGENGRDGTYTGGVTLSATGALSGDSDTAVTFDGSNDYVSIPTLDMRSSYSIECWIKPQLKVTPNYQYVVSVFTSYNDLIVLSIDDNGSILFRTNVAGVSTDLSAPGSTITYSGSWQHVVITYNAASDTAYIYHNGVEVADNTSHVDFAGTDPVISFGQLESLAGFFIGDGDEIAIYLRYLSPEEVADHYAARSITRGVTIEANARGAWGNDITLAKSGTNITVSGANLSGGADGPTSLISYMTGRRTFDIAGDKWSAGETNALQAVQDVVQSEYGLFWQARNGTLTFKDNLYEFAQTSVAASLTLSSQHNAVENAIGKDEVYNRVVVSYQPRGTLSSGVIAKARDVIAVPGKWGEDRSNPADDLPAGGQVTVKIPYVDQGTGQFSGAQSLTLPLVANTDYTVNEAEDGTGIDYTTNANIQITAAINGSDVEVSFVNTALGTLYVRSLQVRGTGIVAYDPTQVIADDSDSQDAYGRNTLSLGLPLPSGNAQNFAQSLAEFLLSKQKDPAHRISAIAFRGQTLIGSTNIFSLEIGDVITITDAQTGISAQKYMITGMRYRVSNGNPASTDAVFAVRRLDDVTYWILENATYGALGTTTRLAL